MSARVVWLTGGICSGKSSARGFLSLLGAHTVDADQVGHSAYAAGTMCFEDVVAAFGCGVVGPDGSIDRKALGAAVFADPGKRRELEKIVWPHIGRQLSLEIDSAVAANRQETRRTIESLGTATETRHAAVARLAASIQPQEARLAALLEEHATSTGTLASTAAADIIAKHTRIRFSLEGTPLVVVEAAVILEAGWTSRGGAVWSTFVDRERTIERMMSSRGSSREGAEARMAAQMEVVDRLQASQVGIDTSGHRSRTWAQLLVALHELRS